MGKSKNTPKPRQVEEKTIVAEEPKEVDAIVDGVTTMLNVRSTPEKKEGNVVTTIENGTEVKVREPRKPGEWYKIIVSDSKKEGYAMKKYIKIV